MIREEAEKILGESIKPDGSIMGNATDHTGPRGYVHYQVGCDDVSIDCSLSPDQLEALAWWVRNNRDGA